MNCFTGLALLKNQSSDGHKTRSMKTIQTQLSDEFRTDAALFRMIFQLQIQLEKYTDEQFCHREEVKAVVESIDQLMMVLLDGD